MKQRDALFSSIRSMISMNTRSVVRTSIVLCVLPLLLALTLVACNLDGGTDPDGTDGGDDGADTIEVTAVSLDTTAATIEPDATLQLTATVAPDDATDTGVTWSSSDDTVATVDSTGLVTAVSAGTATITVTTDDGDFTASCEITVSPPRGTLTEIMTRGQLLATEYSDPVGLDIAVDADGTPYIALNAYDADLVADTKASTEVWQYGGTGTTWTQFDERVAVTDDEAYAPSLVIHDGTVYVAHEYFDDINDPKYDCLVVASSVGSGDGITGVLYGSETNGERGEWQGQTGSSTSCMSVVTTTPARWVCTSTRLRRGRYGL